MKKFVSLAVLLMLAVLFIPAAFAQDPKVKEASFKEIVALTNTKKPEDIDKAYQLGKVFLTTFGKDTDVTVTKIRTFVVNYRENLFFKAVDDKRTADAFSLGKEILAEQPDNTDVLINLAYAGYNVAIGKRDKTYAADSIIYARKAAQLLDAGIIAPKSFLPFKDKPEATAFMYFVDGNLTFEKDMKTAVGSIYKATQFESGIKNSSMPYQMIAVYYEDVYAKMSTDLNAKMAAKTISDADMKASAAKIENVVDLMMDAYARAFQRGEVEKHPSKDTWKARLAQVYKFRKKTDAGLTEYIAQANTVPLPEPAKF